MTAYDVRLSSASARTFGQLDPGESERIRGALLRLAVECAKPGRVGGKAVKSIRGVSDIFHRLRVGDFRVMYDVIDEDQVILVLGIVHRGDLDRWLRNR